MDFLVLAPMPTFPLDVGNRKGFHAFCRGLARHGRVHFVLYAAEGEWRHGVDPIVLRGMSEQWASLHVVTPTRPVHTRPKGLDHEPDEWWDDAIGEHLRWRFERVQYDAMVVKYTWLSRALEFAPPTTARVLFTADRFAGRRRIFEDRGLEAEFFHMTEAGEAAAIGRADIVIAMKAEEEVYFRAIGAREVVSIPHREDDIAVASAPPAADGAVRFGLVGANNTINRRNLLDFLDVLTPIVGAHLAPVEIVVGGSLCEALTDLAHPCVRLIGYVDAIEEFYESIDVALIPMMFSTGIKIKLGEAVAAAFPTLSTAHGAEGYPVTTPELLLPDFTALALACVDLAFDPGRIPALAAAMRRERDVLRAAFDAAMDDLVCRIRALCPGSMLIPDRGLEDISSPGFLRCEDLLIGLRGACRQDVHLLPGTRINQRTLRRLASMGGLYALGEEGALGLAIVDGTLDDDVLALVRPSSLRPPSTYSSALALDWDDALVATLSAIRGDVIVDVNRPEGLDGAARLAAAGGPARVLPMATQLKAACVDLDGPAIGPRLVAPHHWHFQPPLLRRWRHAAPGMTAHVLADRARAPAARALRVAARGGLPQVDVRPIGAVEGLSGFDHVARLLDGTSPAGPRPRLVLDLAPDERAFAPLREIYDRSATPRLRFGGDDPDVLPPLLGAALEALYDAVHLPEALAELERTAARNGATYFSEHAGWAAVWGVQRRSRDIAIGFGP